MANDVQSTQTRPRLLRAWALVRWKITAIIVFTGTSTILIACLAAAGLNVVVRRESANVVEKQVQVLVQASRYVAPAILDSTDACMVSPSATVRLKRLLAYTDDAFPQARATLMVEDPRGWESLLPEHGSGPGRPPEWIPATGFAGLVVDNGRLEIRHLVTRQSDACKATAIVSLPLGFELAKRLSAAAGIAVTPVAPGPFRVHLPNQRVLQTVEGNFIPGISRPAAVVLTVRDWETGALQDWVAFTVRSSYARTFEDVSRLGSQLADWVWFGAALALMALLAYAAGIWMCIHLGTNIANAIDDLSVAARQIGRGNLAWRTPVRSRDQLGDLNCRFNEMAIALERLKAEEAETLRIEGELEVARMVQEHLFPRVAPVARGATVSGRTLAARTVGGDLYDFFELGQAYIGILCADVSGKGIAAALMMANLQAIARAHLSETVDRSALGAAHFVDILNQELTGRFGDNRYATVFWATYNAETSVLTYVNAGNPPAIVIDSAGNVERLSSDGFPIGMFASARYTARELGMAPGSRLVVFSDGLTDAQNPAEEEFGDNRLISCCRTIARGIDAAGVAGRLMNAVAEWSAGAEQFDDTTVVVLNLADEPLRHTQDSTATMTSRISPHS